MSLNFSKITLLPTSAGLAYLQPKKLTYIHLKFGLCPKYVILNPEACTLHGHCLDNLKSNAYEFFQVDFPFCTPPAFILSKVLWFYFFGSIFQLHIL
jgi:hypothetical protein